MRRERGAALLAVLFVLLICELAIFAVTSEIHHIARRYLLDRDRTAASRLAESGVEHAHALLAAGPALPPRIDASLAEGQYAVTLARGHGDHLLVKSRGRAASGFEVELEVTGRVQGEELVVLARAWRTGGR